MQSFITSSCLLTCSKNLDNKRLGKQRLEGVQMLNAMNNPHNRGWKNHPCTEMWRPYQESLKFYINCIIEEWIFRGFKNTMQFFPQYSEQMPDWFHWQSLQRSHKASLLRKNPHFYKNIFIKNIDDYEKLVPYLWTGYLWPTHLSPEQCLIAAQDNVDPKEICSPISPSQLKSIPDLQYFIEDLRPNV